MSVSRLSLRGLTKSFGENLVLRGLDLDLEPGEIHALIGGNGAGKSTLSKIICGLERRDAGETWLDGQAFAPANRQAAQAAGMVMVLQELSVLPTLSVAENLFLDHLPSRHGLLDWQRLRTGACTALARVGLKHLDPEMPAGELGLGHQQLIEIAAALAKDCRLLIMDEPTAALSSAEIVTLFDLLRGLRTAGTTILYISHRLEEIAQLVDRVSVLRDGRLVATLPAAMTGRSELIRLMAGGEVLQLSRAAGPAPAGDVMLRVSDLQAGRAVQGVSLTVRCGEIVGLGGLVGAGRTELLRAIFGADAASGEVSLMDGQQPARLGSPHEAVARGVAFVPEDRKHHGIFAPLSLRYNASIAGPPTRPGWPGWIDAPLELAEVQSLLARLQVRHRAAEQPIRELSGGNQQKLVIGRWVERGARLWLLDEPTRGVDVGARHEIYALLRALAQNGAAILVASSDYEELVALSDRVLVMSAGRVTAEFGRDALTPERFMAAAFAGFFPEAPRAN